MNNPVLLKNKKSQKSPISQPNLWSLDSLTKVKKSLIKAS